MHTDSIVVTGTITLPFTRVTEIMNSADRDYLAIESARIAPLVLPEQVTGPNPAPVLVRRTQVHFAATYTDPQHARPLAPEYAAVRKVPTACYGFLGPFVFHGYLHLRPGLPLQEVLETGNLAFVPITRATVYLTARPDLPPRQHEVIIINRAFLDAMYLT